MKKYLFILMLSVSLFWGSQAKAAESPIASTKAIEALVDAFSFQTDGTIEVSVDKLTVDNIIIDGDSITNASNDITIGNITISALTNSDGIVFGSLGTAAKGINLSGIGLGVGDSFIFYNSNVKWSNVTADLWGMYSDYGFFPQYTNSPLFRNIGNVGLRSHTAGDVQLTADKGNIISSLVANLTNHLLGNKEEVGAWGGDGVSNGTTTITDVGGAAHGLSLAAGDLIHITDSTTSADEGNYRIVSDDGTNIVVNRALSGSDTDLEVTFYQDVILFGATDGTNGQRIMNYSHQDKPLQIGGDTLSAANAAMGSEDIVIGNHIEVKGLAFVSSSTFTFTTEGDITDPLPSTQLLLDGDNDTENDTIDLQDGEAAGQLLTLIAAADIDANDTVTINFADTTATNAPAVVFDKVGENAELEWTGTTWIVKSLQTSL
ncbi:hypothetical protein LCGC14_1623480 [marine sediment metagenome]|uniref:Uncharacterized protein n=1 Tax=marine sediment metagenome TaxID=412755 RepID=A0A0F9I4R5_9ZZZZ